VVPNANLGEVWLADLGIVAKTRSCLVVSVPHGPSDRALIALVPHTTSVRGTRFEAMIPKRFLKQGAFDAQGIITVAPPRLIRKLGSLTGSELATVEVSLKAWLGL
jgi:mRNA interferase MazF